MCSGAQASGLDGARAFWVTENKLAVQPQPKVVSYALRTCSACTPDFSHASEAEVPLSLGRTISADDYPSLPNLAGYSELEIPSEYVAGVGELLRGGLSLVQRDGTAGVLQLTGLQVQGVLDDVFSTQTPLGVQFNGDEASISVWAPTATRVRLLANNEPRDMDYDASSGVWSFKGSRSSVENLLYNFEVLVFTPETGQMETNIVTDPYSVALSMNSLKSQAVDLDSASWKPSGWDALKKPAFTAPEDMTIYELHVREFSSNDQSMAENVRGKAAAFTMSNATSVRHLKGLSDAGLSHVHLLPMFDCGSINEDWTKRREASMEDLLKLPGDSSKQQELVSQFAAEDAWNWCYDPFHYGVPEGSYVQNEDIDGGSRVLEFRRMIQALNEQIGVRVVMDVVYNHVFAAGQSAERSVLDKVVPGYYLRLGDDGVLQQSSCCPDTASEFKMMERLMLDTQRSWMQNYKVDGFRYDLMGFHTVGNLVHVQETLQADRPDLYFYGEGWSFGSASDKGLRTATQFNLAGTGVGTFNDRMRDAIAGGGFGKDGPVTVFTQGFVNGLSYDWNGQDYDGRDRDDLLRQTDRIKIGIAGNLQNYEIVDRFGSVTKGVDCESTGYTLDPQEAVQYVSSHDDFRLFDMNAYKAAPGTSPEDLGRMQSLANSIVALSQGIPFFTSGIEIMQSKSLDRDTYDAGDWFNRLDYSLQSNNFPAGLPLQDKNGERWNVSIPVLNSPISPSTSTMRACTDHLQELLAIRMSSPLFRLQTAADISSRLHFYNDGPDQESGLITFSLYDETSPMLVVINADKFGKDLTISDTNVLSKRFVLHPILQSSSDPVVQTAHAKEEAGQFWVPARTTAVFVGSALQYV